MEKIAIIGMAGRFPGAGSVGQLWENVKNSVEALTEFSDKELLESGVSQSLIDNPDYVKSRFILKNAEMFDAAFFGMSPRESECTDPQHRIFLETAWEALESAGYDPEAYSGSIGVFAGCGMNQYLLQNLIANHRALNSMNERQTQVCSDKDFLSTRVSYKLNLKGPSLDIQTACSTSLVAVHIACQNLLDYQCDMALSGGANVQLPRVGGYLYSDGDMRSPDGHCRAFDAAANGTAFGDGVGIVVLKRLQDALEDRDTILAVISGTAINNDGAHKAGFSAPSIDGQATVISMAHEMAALDPEAITCIEAHGTGTALGDPIEIAALTKAFRRSTNKKGYCAIGTVKANIGHLDAAAGVAGLIKTVLSIYHKQIPPNINFNNPKPELRLEASPFYVNREIKEWKANAQPRCAGVSSFGVGGTNAHAVVEEAPMPVPADRGGEWQLLTFSARTEVSLGKASDNLLEHLEQNQDIILADAAYTLQTGRRHFEYRCTVLCTDRDSAISAIKNRDATRVHTGQAVSSKTPKVFMFTGQGSQYAGMGLELFENEACFRDVIDYCSEVLTPLLNMDLRSLIFKSKPIDNNSTNILNQTNIAQPALFMIEYALAKLWKKHGVKPDAMIGHSIGEYTAACFSGVFSLDEALKLVVLRGALMQQQAFGSMLSVALSEDSVLPYLNDDIEIAALNSPESSVLSGETEKIQLLEQVLKKDGINFFRLHTSHAFHSRIMEPVLEHFERAFDNINLKNPEIPFISNLTGDWITPSQATSPAYWADHLRKTVRFKDGIKKLLKDSNRIFIEAGPGNTLCSLVKQSERFFNSHDNTGKIHVIQSLRHPRQQFSDTGLFLQSLGKAWLAGAKINWLDLYKNEIRYRIPLPTYPFEHKRFWLEPDSLIKKNRSSPCKISNEQTSTSNETSGNAFTLSADDLQSGAEKTCNHTVQTVTSIWQDLLGINNIDSDSNFFDLGGDSVWASQVLLRISDKTGITLSLKEMFDNPTINSLARVLKAKSDDHEKPQPVPIQRINRKKKLPLSQAQKRLWFLSQLEPENPAFNLALGLQIEGPLKADLLCNAIDAVVQRHESLRTTFINDQGDPRAVINNHTSIMLNKIDATEMGHDEKASLQIIRQAAARPFDLEKGPLYRWFLVHLKKDFHILVYIVHHIVFDGWSLGIVLKEIAAQYDALQQSKEPLLPELNIQYVDYSAWHEEWLKTRNLTGQMEYWKKQLAGELPIMQLPFDRPRPKIPDYKGSLEFFELSENLSNQLRVLSKQEGSTFFMIFLTAFKILLFRYSGQDDIITGTPVANRNHVEFEKLVGLFINMLVLRSDLSGNPTFKELLARVRKTSLDAFSHQTFPFEQLVDLLKPSRDMSHHPLYQVMFAFHNFSFPPVALKDVKFQNIIIDRGSSQVDLWMYLWEENNIFKGAVEYSTELFDQATISRMTGHYLNLLNAAADDPLQKIDSCPLLNEKEKKHILFERNKTQLEVPETSSFHQLFENQANRLPHNNAVTFGNREITYQELNKRSSQLANYLRDLGVGTNTLIGIYVERSIEMIVGILGVLKAGGAYVPLDPTYPQERIAFIIEDTDMPVILTLDHMETALPENRSAILCLDADWNEIASEKDNNPEHSTKGNNLAYVIYTSGSTGRPKGVKVQHRAVVNFLSSMRQEPGFAEDDVMLAVTTLSFDIHVLEIFLPLITGGRVVIADRETASDGSLLLRALQDSRATVMQATPGTWRLLLAAGWQGTRNLKLLCGGEAFPLDLLKELLPRAGSVWNMYGPTETTVWSTCFRITDSQSPILIGRPIANTQVYILDRLMQPVPVGVPGELYIGGNGVTPGYLNLPDLTQKQFLPDPFSLDQGARLYKTGDLARFRPDGNLEYLSRIDTQVKVRGFRIELGEIESVLNEHPSVDKCAAAVCEEQPGDMRMVAFIVPKAGMDPTASNLRKHLQNRLPDYMIPQHFVLLEELPLTPAGKIDRKNLPVAEIRESPAPAEYAAPRNKTEELLTGIWQNITGLSCIGIHDDFFDIGGHSLLAVRLFSAIEKKLGVRLPLALLYQASTIEQMSQFIKEKNCQAPWSSLVPIKPGGSKPPLFLIHGAGGNVLLYRQLAHHLGSDQPVFGLQAKGLDGKKPFHTSIEDMASEYISEIQNLQPHGPYFLAGYCMGGTIAYEMACQLEKSHHKTALVAMFDTYNGWEKSSLPKLIYHNCQRIAFHILNYNMIDKAGRKAFLKEKALESKRRVFLSLEVKLTQLLHKAKLRSRHPLVIMDHINDAAAYNYFPRPYPGKIDVFKTISAYSGYEDPLLGWGSNLTGSIEVHQLNVYPAGTLNEPFVAELASKLRDCLDRARL